MCILILMMWALGWWEYEQRRDSLSKRFVWWRLSGWRVMVPFDRYFRLVVGWMGHCHIILKGVGITYNAHNVSHVPSGCGLIPFSVSSHLSLSLPPTATRLLSLRPIPCMLVHLQSRGKNLLNHSLIIILIREFVSSFWL